MSTTRKKVKSQNLFAKLF